MLLKKLILFNNKESKEIRTIKFHKGVNFVVDKERSKKHNHVGKTTFLKLIDIALGSRDKQYLYKDSETGEVNKELFNLIEDKKISVILILSDSLIKDKSKDIELKVDLFKKGHRQIDSEQLTEKKYNERLNEILFSNKANIPSFRQLIPSFVRISVKKDRNEFLYNLFPTTSKTQYHTVYDYLFDIGDPKRDKTIEETTKKLKSFEQAKKKYLDVSSITDEPDVINQMITLLRKKSETVQNQINDLIKKKSFLSNRKKISEIRQKINSLDEKIDFFNYNIESAEDSIESVEKEKSNQVDDKLTSDFFYEIKGLLPEINKTFDEMVNFNNALYSNKIKYLENIKLIYSKRLKKTKKEKQEVINENEDILSLIKKNDVGKYDELCEELTNTNKKIAEKTEVLTTLNRFNEKIENLKTNIKNLESDENISEENGNKRTNNDYKDKMQLFNKFFTPLVHKITGDEPVLVYHKEKNTFPLGIESLNTGTSTGTRKAHIICYDIAYQSFANEENKTVPRFVVHDILESIDGENLKKLISIINNNDFDIQFVIAILKEKLNSANINSDQQKKYSILQLSSSDKLFKE